MAQFHVLFRRSSTRIASTDSYYGKLKKQVKHTRVILGFDAFDKIIGIQEYNKFNYA